jgi:hypothetical protein
MKSGGPKGGRGWLNERNVKSNVERFKTAGRKKSVVELDKGIGSETRRCMLVDMVVVEVSIGYMYEFGLSQGKPEQVCCLRRITSANHTNPRYITQGSGRGGSKWAYAQ